MQFRPDKRYRPSSLGLKSDPAAPLFVLARRPGALTGYPAAVIIIIVVSLFALIASRSNSATFDEGAHIAGGYIHWTLGQPRIHTENGYLSQAIAAFPILFLRPHLPDPTSFAFQHAEPFLVGRDFLYHANTNFNELLLFARAAIGLLTAVTALTVYAWSRNLFSALAGILSLLLFILAPLVLSHGFLATSDMPVTCFFLLSLAAFWWTLHRVTPVRIALTSLLLASLFLSKMSAPLILPVIILLAIIRIFSATPLPVGKYFLTTRRAKLALAVALLLVNACIICMAIWATSDFTFSAFKDSPPASSQTFWPVDGWNYTLQYPSVVATAITFARDRHLLPEYYLYGIAYVATTTTAGESALKFADRIPIMGGAWWFHPYAFLITTPLPILLLIAVAAVATARKCKQSSTKDALYKAAPLLLFFILYWLVAIASSRTAGPRHLLPVFPVLCIFLGSAAWLIPQHRAWRICLPLLILWLIVESAYIAPYELSYFNELTGGPAQGYHHLVDSALDWGQDLPALSTYLSDHNFQNLPTYLAYFGTAEPEAYGIHAINLPSFIERNDPRADLEPLRAGAYCISATLLQGVYTRFPGPYTQVHEGGYQSLRAQFDELRKSHAPMQDEQFVGFVSQFRHAEFTRLTAYLRAHHPPDARAGYSILIYNLTSQDINATLNGPPNYDLSKLDEH